jgi:DNA invertase Pin-like site-specific DNA recombinase
MAKRVGVYARVSTDKSQTVENQLRELQAVAPRLDWDIVGVFTDEGISISGAKGRERRPAFDRLLKGITRREFDLVAAWSVDRLGRSLRDLVAFLSEINSRGVDLYLHQQGLDTSSPAGRAMFGMLSVFAEFERAMIVERVRTGINRARANGKRLGRPPISKATGDAIRVELAAGKGMIKIARSLGVGVGTVSRIKNEQRAD